MTERHNNISIFIPHLGCPNTCSFCNQRAISHTSAAPTAEQVGEILKNAFENIPCGNTEIAFFGGSFTAIDRSYMISLLEAAEPYIQSGKASGIRISTRPDKIDDEILGLLKKYNVTAVELGAQSMDDEVLAANERGHSAEAVRISSEMIRDHGFELGLQMMTGLYRSTVEKDRDTAYRIIDLRPDTVRIYPTVILKNTRLGELFQSGVYVPYPFEECAELCAELLELFEKNNIRVIKLGLHASETVESDMLGGYYHQAFREICEGIIFRKRISAELRGSGNFTVFVAPDAVSKAAGHKKCNKNYFAEKGIYIKFKPDKNISGRNIIIKKDE